MRNLRNLAVTLLAAITLLCPSQVEAAGDVLSQAESFINSFPKKNNEIRFKSDTKFARTIYVDGKRGDDKNKGLSQQSAIKTIYIIIQ